MTAPRKATKVPPFTLVDKRAVVKSKDHRGREQLAFGDARSVWINYALAPLAGGLTDSIDMRFVGGAFWYRVKLDRAEALKLLEEEPGTEAVRSVISSRYSLEATPVRRNLMRCQFSGVSRRCYWDAVDGWTTCRAHYDQGGPREEKATDEGEG